MRTSKSSGYKIVQMKKNNDSHQRKAAPSPTYQSEEPLRVALPPITPSSTTSKLSVTVSSFKPSAVVQPTTSLYSNTAPSITSLSSASTVPMFQHLNAILG